MFFSDFKYFLTFFTHFSKVFKMTQIDLKKNGRNQNVPFLENFEIELANKKA